MESSERPVVRVTEIGEYIRHHSCERRFKLEFNNRQLAQRLPFANRLFNTIDPVLQEAGRMRENQLEDKLRLQGYTDFFDNQSTDIVQGEDSKVIDWLQFVEYLGQIQHCEPAFGREIFIEDNLGVFQVRGQIDFIVLTWHDKNPRLLLVECKASRKDRTYHRIQVALYALLVKKYLAQNPIAIGEYQITNEDVDCVVARIDEATEHIQDILSLEPLDLSTAESDAMRLLAEDGALRHIVATDLDRVDYQLNLKCDGCVFNVHCLPESARQRRLELIGIEPSTSRILRHSGIATLDDLANLDLDSPEADSLRGDPGFTESLNILREKARVRCRTLPGGRDNPDTFDVHQLPFRYQSQLPVHVHSHQRLIRIFFYVGYDYVENRIGALAAHITNSEGHIETPLVEDDAGNRLLDERGFIQFSPKVRERTYTEDGNRINYTGNRPLTGKEIVRFKASQWTGRYDEDNGSERELIQGFFFDLVEAIAEIAESDTAPLHFYLWSKSEMSQLMQACARVGSQLLGHLRELFGCRESLEQLIFSSLHDEIDRRFALAWTGRGLSVVSSLSWFGQRYHWVRRVGGNNVDLSKEFTQDIFDFKTDLWLNDNNQWVIEQEDGTRHKFEIRARFNDSLTAPYWRAVWKSLPDPKKHKDGRIANAIRRYNRASLPGMLSAYLRARVHALRWLEERIKFKNPEIVKPLVSIPQLPNFSLGVDNTSQAAIDFLRFDQHVTVTNWIAENLTPPTHRVPNGRTLPLSNVIITQNNTLEAQIDLTDYPVTLEILEGRCPFQVGSFVRLAPCSSNPEDGQTIGQLLRGGATCIINDLDWVTGYIELNVIPSSNPTRYIISSISCTRIGNLLYQNATIQGSPSDFVDQRVDRRLSDVSGHHAYQWFHPESPTIPSQTRLSDDIHTNCTHIIDMFRFPGQNHELTIDQKRACLEGLHTRVQLLLGPPGTGKSATTAVAILLRIFARYSEGNVIIISGSTHTAVNNLLLRIDQIVQRFQDAASSTQSTLPPIKIAKVVSSLPAENIGGSTEIIPASSSVRRINADRRDAILILGGTTSAILKLTSNLDGTAAFRPNFETPMLIVDEASMMVFPHFLALSTLVEETGEILLAGDHRQLAPIVSHDWDNEDRPPIEMYKPYVSAYEAIRGIGQHNNVSPDQVRQTELRYTHRLPPAVRDLVGRLYRHLDDVELQGRPFTEPYSVVQPADLWNQIWNGPNGLYLILHNERESRQHNLFEVDLIRELLNASQNLQPDSVAIVTPHRAQRSQLSLHLSDFEENLKVVDTVERVQGEGIENVIVSATVSDPSAIGARAEFILNLNRSNVAFSRSEERLIVVVSESLLNHIPVEIDHYNSALLWKILRDLCSELLGTIDFQGHSVRVFTPSLDTLRALV